MYSAWISGRRRWRSSTARSSSGRVVFGFLAAEGGATVRFGAALGELCLDFWPQEVAQQYGLGQLWCEFCLGFWPQEVALQYGSEQLWVSYCLDFWPQKVAQNPVQNPNPRIPRITTIAEPLPPRTP